jgi:hypothetical protein
LKHKQKLRDFIIEIRNLRIKFKSDKNVKTKYKLFVKKKKRCYQNSFQKKSNELKKQ